MIARVLRVGAATLCEWKTVHPEFAAALSQGRRLPSPPETPTAPSPMRKQARDRAARLRFSRSL